VRRKTTGFLFLTLIVATGVVFVESRVRDADEQRIWTQGSSSLYRVVLGGELPDEVPGPVPAPPEPLPDDPASRRNPPPKSAPPASRAPRDPPRSFQYRVKRGDTLGQIVKDHLGSASTELLRRVARENQIDDLNDIVEGTLLTISIAECERHESAPGECLRDLAIRFYGKADRTSPLRKANPDLPASDSIPLEEGLVLWVPR